MVQLFSFSYAHKEREVWHGWGNKMGRRRAEFTLAKHEILKFNFAPQIPGGFGLWSAEICKSKFLVPLINTFQQ
jgi:hypothetical protein